MTVNPNMTLEEAIEIFEKIRDTTPWTNERFDATVIALSAMYEKQKPSDRWIPCAERLPKAQMRYELLRKPKEYIVDMVYEGSDEHIVTTLGYGDIYDLCGYVEGYKAVWVRLVEYTSVGEGYTVLAWQPLPQPWTGEKKGV